MKKRTGVERAVIVMAVVVVLLAIALIVVNAAGIRIHKSAPEALAATNLPQFPFSDEPELILGSGQTPSRLVCPAWRPGFLAVSGYFRVSEHGNGRQVLLCPRG